jgi:CheY-like chemotaxis protein
MAMAKKILIIDDEEDMRIYLQTLLRKAGYETDTAVNGEDALSKLDSVKPDLITLDILMPQKSGLKFFQALREGPQTRETPVLVVSGVTGHPEFFDRENLGGPTEFVDKPIQPEAFVAQVRQLLGD